MSNHFYFVFSNELRAGSLIQATLAILKYYVKVQKGKERWLKDKKQYTAHWTDPKTKEPKNSKPINYKIIANFILQKEVIFSPEPSFSKRLPIRSKKAGYLSSCWPEREINKLREQF